jgi:hypothetical protein
MKMIKQLYLVMLMIISWGYSASLYGMQNEYTPGALPTLTTWELLKNDISSGELMLIAGLETKVLFGAMTALKIWHHGCFSFSDLRKGVFAAVALGVMPLWTVVHWPIILITRCSAIVPYEKTNFYGSEKAFAIRELVRSCCALISSLISVRILRWHLQENLSLLKTFPALVAW